MKNADYIPHSEAKYLEWLENFCAVAKANVAALGITADEMKALDDFSGQYDSSIKQSVALTAELKSMNERKVSIKKKSIACVRGIVKQIQAKQTIANDLKKQLQITVPGQSSPVPVVPFQPLSLTVNVVSVGSYELKWDRNGNNRNTLFLVEAMFEDQKNFIPIITTSKSNFIHTGNKAGARITYRVKAQHGTIFSPPSLEAIINF